MLQTGVLLRVDNNTDDIPLRAQTIMEEHFLKTNGNTEESVVDDSCADVNDRSYDDIEYLVG